MRTPHHAAFAVILGAALSFAPKAYSATTSEGTPDNVPGKGTDYQHPTPETILKDLAKLHGQNGHPRILANAAAFERVKAMIGHDANITAWFKDIKEQADLILKEKPVTYSKTSFAGILTQARTILDYAQILGLTYRMTGDRVYADRLWKEISTVCDKKQFPDWGFSHYGDAVEMSTGFAIAYDWLYDYWTPEQRKTMVENVDTYCLKYALSNLGRPGNGKTRTNNMRLVYAGGISVPALAFLDEPAVRTVASKLVSKALVFAEAGMAVYAPDGAWYEGVTYWGYATKYAGFMMASLDASLGTSYGLESAPGFSKTALWPIELTGPEGAFNFGDSSKNFQLPPIVSWLGYKFDSDYGSRRADDINKALAANKAAEDKIASDIAENTAEGRKDAKILKKTIIAAVKPMDLLYYKPDFAKPATKLPLDKYFRDGEVAAFRNGWSPDDLYAAIKFGGNNAFHCHLDIGTFVLDALGVRWAESYGSGSYNWKGYLERDETKGRPYRFDYYLARAEGNNTIVINPDEHEPDQNVNAVTKIVRYASNSDGGMAIGDMTTAYDKNATSAVRGMMLTNHRKQIVLQDEITTKAPSEVNWGMHTTADIKIADDGRSAILEKDGKRLWVGIISSEPAKFSIVTPTNMAPRGNGQTLYDLMKKLAIEFKGISKVNLTVLMTPLDQGQDKPSNIPTVVPLSQWHMK